MMRGLAFKSAAGALCTLLATAAWAEPASQGFRLTAQVPVTCFATAQGGTMLLGAGASGTVTEACNNPGGYRVLARYRPLTASESASIRYGDRVLQLPASGEVVLRTADMAQIRTVAYQVEAAQLDAPVALTFAITPA
jgi:hypothetical protein